MIRFRLAELIADAQFKTGRRIKLIDISEATGINRMTLSRMTNQRGYSTSTDTIDKLCKYFGCAVGEVAAYVDEPLPAEAEVAAAKAVGKVRATKAATRPSKARATKA